MGQDRAGQRGISERRVKVPVSLRHINVVEIGHTYKIMHNLCSPRIQSCLSPSHPVLTPSPPPPSPPCAPQLPPKPSPPQQAYPLHNNKNNNNNNPPLTVPITYTTPPLTSRLPPSSNFFSPPTSSPLPSLHPSLHPCFPPTLLNKTYSSSNRCQAERISSTRVFVCCGEATYLSLHPCRRDSCKE